MTSVMILKQKTSKLTLEFSGELTLYDISHYERQIKKIDFSKFKNVDIDLRAVNYFDTAISIFLNKQKIALLKKNIVVNILTDNKEFLSLIQLTQTTQISQEKKVIKKNNFISNIGKNTHLNYLGFLSFMMFFGELFNTKLHYIKSFKNIRYKEIAFEINESGVKALWIIALTSFLIGLVVAYQSAYQLKLYGANIFIVDMLGISILRELAPLITAIVIAGRSGSAFTAQIGAMKITQELDAMRTMGFDPHIFLIMPRIIALMIALPILIFVADMMGILGGMLVASIDLNITTELFLDRFNEVIAAKHFYIGMLKGPFFAFLIATISIYRGMMVRDDTQSIGFNTTKSVVEAIFAVIVCDAIFSIIFTNLGI